MSKYNIYTFNHHLQYWIKHKVGLEAQVVHASLMRSPVIFGWKPRLINKARFDTLTARSLPDRPVATDTDNIVVLRPNFFSLSAHSG